MQLPAVSEEEKRRYEMARQEEIKTAERDEPWVYWDARFKAYLGPSSPDYDPERYLEITGKLVYQPHVKVMKLLDELLDHGLFGHNIDAVVDGLVCERIRQLTEENWLDYPSEG